MNEGFNKLITDLADRLKPYARITAYQEEDTISRYDALELSQKHERLIVIGLDDKDEEGEEDENTTSTA